MPDPFHFLREAVKAVPAVRYALGVGGIFAAIAIVYSLKLEPRVAFVGTLVMFVLMGVLVIFARVTSLASPRMLWPALVFTWFTLFVFVAVSFSLFTSVFLKWPLDLAYWLVGTPSAASLPAVNSLPTSIGSIAANLTTAPAANGPNDVPKVNAPVEAIQTCVTDRKNAVDVPDKDGNPVLTDSDRKVVLRHTCETPGRAIKVTDSVCTAGVCGHNWRLEGYDILAGRTARIGWKTNSSDSATIKSTVTYETTRP